MGGASGESAKPKIAIAFVFPEGRMENRGF